MMMNCFVVWLTDEGRLALFPAGTIVRISDRISPSQISDTLRGEFKPPQSLSSGLVEWSCAVVITTAPRPHKTLVTSILSIFCSFFSRFFCSFFVGHLKLSCRKRRSNGVFLETIYLKLLRNTRKRVHFFQKSCRFLLKNKLERYFWKRKVQIVQWLGNTFLGNPSSPYL